MNQFGVHYNLSVCRFRAFVRRLHVCVVCVSESLRVIHVSSTPNQTQPSSATSPPASPLLHNPPSLSFACLRIRLPTATQASSRLNQHTFHLQTAEQEERDWQMRAAMDVAFGRGG